MLRLLKSDTNMLQFLCNIENPISIKGLYLDIAGTSAGTAVYVKDINRMYLRMRGRDFVSADFDFMQVQNEMNGGTVLRTNNGLVGAFRFNCYIPRNMGDRNVELIEASDNCEFLINFGPNVAAFTTGFTCSLYADLEEGETNYQLLIQQQAAQYGAATAATRETFQCENILEAYLTDWITPTKTLSGSALTSLVWDVGERQGMASVSHQLGCSNILSRTEAAYLLALRLFKAEGSISSMLDDSMGVQFTISGAAQPQILMLGAYMNPRKNELSKAAETVRLAKAEERKTLAGHKRTVAAIKTVLKES